jgi:hypothetical protein
VSKLAKPPYHPLMLVEVYAVASPESGRHGVDGHAVGSLDVETDVPDRVER